MQHVITSQPYIPELIRTMEAQGVLPLPIFINGVEAHTLVRCTVYCFDPHVWISDEISTRKQAMC